MSRRTLRTDDEAGFLIAISDELAENRALFNCHIELTLATTSTRGKFDIIAKAYKRPRVDDSPPYAITITPYPSVSANRLHAAFYRACIRIGGELSRIGPYRPPEDSPSTDDSRQG